MKMEEGNGSRNMPKANSNGKVKSRMQLSSSNLADNACEVGLESGGKNPATSTRTVKQNRNQKQKPQGPPTIKRPMEKSVREMGRKARIRLEEEKSKRKEIVRLTDTVHEAMDASTRTGTRRKKGFNFQKTESSRVASKQASSRKRRRKATSTSTTSAQSRLPKDSKNCDTFSPDVQCASFFDLPKAGKSQFIRIHGLPVGTTVDSIYHFFAGLNPSCVIVLPSINIQIVGFDIDIIAPQGIGKKKVPTIKRYPETFRVYVKFQSPMVAEAAIRRSGEMMNHMGGKVAISLSPVPKSFVKVLDHDLNIECIRSSATTTVEEALKKVEKQMTTVIQQILWLKALHTLRLKFPLEAIDIGDKDSEGSCRISVHDIENIFPTRNNDEKGRKNLVSLHNKLFDTHEAICKKCAPFQCEEIDPILTSMNPSFRLTTIAVSWLMDHMEMIQKCLISSTEL